MDVDWLNSYTRDARQGKPDPLRGAIAGAAGGFVGSMRMAGAQLAWQKLNEKLAEAGGTSPLVQPRGEEGDGLPSYGDREQAAGARETAGGVIKTVARRPAGEREKGLGGVFVHQATGVLAGAAYGAACEYVPALRRAYGLPLGIGTWALGREAGQTAAGLSPRPGKQAAVDHAVALGAHLVYGVFTELVRNRLRRALKD